MSSTTVASVVLTATARLSITTPFVQPADCKTQWSSSEIVEVVGGTTLWTPVMVSEPASSCYPSGWDEVAARSRLRFSPGVCPQGWTYNQMGEKEPRSATTAFCCDSGFTYQLSADDPDDKNRCTRVDWTSATQASLEPNPASSQVTMKHQPWAVTWAASDTSTLTPKLPIIMSSMTLSTWTPGEEIPDGMGKPNKQNNGPQFEINGFSWIFVIGLPIFGLLITAFFIWICARACYQRSRQRGVVYIVEGTTPPTAVAVEARVLNK